MGRLRSTKLTNREASLMNALWTLGRATAEELRDALPPAERTHDSTIRTILRVLERKHQVAHERQGKAFVYRPLVARDDAQTTALRDLLARFFGGSAEQMVLRMIEDEHLTLGELQAIQRAVASDDAPASTTARSAKTKKSR